MVAAAAISHEDDSMSSEEQNYDAEGNENAEKEESLGENEIFHRDCLSAIEEAFGDAYEYGNFENYCF